MSWLYFIIVVCANTIGAVSGMGGGVIIKPLLDAVGKNSLLVINFCSSFAVFVMAVVSTIRQLKAGIHVKLPTVITIALGAIMGGILGDKGVSVLLLWMPQSHVNLIQIVITIITLTLALAFTRQGRPLAKGTNQIVILLLLGVILGSLATFLGIGGGPINVAALMLVIGLPIKPATVYSIILIFFSQLAKLIFSVGLVQDGSVSIGLLLTVACAAVVGGYVGATISQHVSDSAVLQLYRLVVISVIVLNLVNGYNIVA